MEPGTFIFDHLQLQPAQKSVDASCAFRFAALFCEHMACVMCIKCSFLSIGKG